MLFCDEYLTPTSLEEAFELMRTRDRFRIVAGATDTLPWAREGRAGDVDIPALIDVTGIPELRECKVESKRVRIGAATPIQRFLDNSMLCAALPAMPRCAVWFADDQIRESATVGGNIVNASPAADLTPPLLAHAAEVELAAVRNGAIARRRMPLEGFVRGPGQTALEPGEILVAVECDSLSGYGGSFEKVGHRRSLVISLVCVAVLLKLDANGSRFEDVRLAVGGIGPVPHRLTEIEAFLRSAPISAARLEQAADLPVGLVQSRTRQAYRREVVRGFLLRGLLNATRRAGVDPRVLAPELEASFA
jgi:carbon-monoxide dehydrogenase medium subunit/xanthine dehydrogenase FAD-binding subunit